MGASLGGTRSLASCIACPTCLMPWNTPHVASGLVALSAVQPPWHGLAVFVFWHNGPELLGFQANMKGQLCRVWDGLRVSPRTASSQRAKLCTYFAWSLRPSQLKTVLYFEVPMPNSRLQLLMQSRMGSHALPVEQGRLARPAVPRHLRRCTLCGTRALGDERHFVFYCPHFAHIRRQFRSLYQDADGTMQCFVWHKDQKAVCHCLAAILNLAGLHRSASALLSMASPARWWPVLLLRCSLMSCNCLFRCSGRQPLMLCP